MKTRIIIPARLKSTRFPNKLIKVFNGKLESRLLHFPIYEGTKKVHKLRK